MSSEIVAYEEILGEQNRGGQQLVGDGDAAYEILGELMKKSPAFAAYAQKRMAANRPVLRKTAPTKWRDWQIDFGPVSGTAGLVTTITVNPQVLFEGQRVMATDDYTTPGYGTRIRLIQVGQENQRPNAAGRGTLTAFFANNAIGTGIKWDTCQIGNTISVDVEFVHDCTFDMTVFGRAVK
jgi:hypothetical protein